MIILMSIWTPKAPDQIGSSRPTFQVIPNRMLIMFTSYSNPGEDNPDNELNMQ